jgi:hypothetical protein
MALLKIRDANGNVQEIVAIRGNDGKDYILTDDDKREIAEMVTALMSVNAVGVGDEVDLSLYALKTDIPDLSGYALKSEIPNVSGFALKTELPDVSGYALKNEIPDVSGFANKSELPDVSAFMTEAQVLALIQANMPTSGDEVSY